MSVHHFKTNTFIYIVCILLFLILVEVGSSNKQYVELAVPEKTTEGEVSGTYSKY